jgi:hypothetical protein
MRKMTLVHLLIGSLFFIFIYAASLNAQAQVTSQTATTFPFEPYEARYKITWRGVEAGVSVHKLTQVKPNRFYFEAVTAPSLSFLPFRSFESTIFSWKKNEIKPEEFQYTINEGSKKRVAHLQFDWAKHKINSLNNNDPFELELSEHHQDKLTHLFMIRSDLQKLNHANQAITYMVATGDKSKSYTFEHKGIEMLDTPMGKVQAIKLQNILHGDRVTTIWFAKEWDYLPVKILHARGGKIITSAEIMTLSGETK